MQRYGWVVVTCVALAAAGACKKKSEPTATTPAADAAATSAATDAVAAVDAAGAAAPDVPVASDAGPAAPPAGGGMQLLASLMGGGAGGAGLAAPSAPPPGPGLMDLLRPGARRALEAAEESPLAAAMSAAELAGALADAKATGEAVAVQSTDDSPQPAVPPYDPADPCGAFVPTLVLCLKAELGETLEEDEVERATAECRTEFAGWDDAQRAKLRECMAAPNCAAKLACVTELEDAVDGGEGGDTTGGTAIGPLPADADFCTKLAYRTTECVDLPATSELLQPQIEECRRELDSIPAELRAKWETCFERPCDQLFECMSDVEPEDLDVPDAPTSAGGLGSLPVPDPAAVAALPPQVRQLCTQFAGKFDSCWDTLVGAAGGLADPSVAGSMSGMRAELLTAVNNACLEAAIGSPQMFESMFGLFRPCFAVPCAQFQDCLMNATTGVVAP